MATLVMADGTRRKATADQARRVWEVLEGRAVPSEDQATFCASVREVVFNWRNAPDEWLRAHHTPSLEAIILGCFMVDAYGNPTRPEPLDHDTQRVSRLLGIQPTITHPYPQPERKDLL